MNIMLKARIMPLEHLETPIRLQGARESFCSTFLPSYAPTHVTRLWRRWKNA